MVNWYSWFLLCPENGVVVNQIKKYCCLLFAQIT
jgi:hypothetical protein